MNIQWRCKWKRASKKEEKKNWNKINSLYSSHEINWLCSIGAAWLHGILKSSPAVLFLQERMEMEAKLRIVNEQKYNLLSLRLVYILIQPKSRQMAMAWLVSSFIINHFFFLCFAKFQNAQPVSVCPKTFF